MPVVKDFSTVQSEQTEMRNFRILSLLFLVFFFHQTALAKPLKVGVVVAAPFVIVDDKVIDGIAVQLFEAVGDLEKFEYQLIKYK